MTAQMLRNIRTRRTKLSNQIRGQISYMLEAPAPTIYPDGLPSWWPFWSDSLKANVRNLYRLGYEVRNAEHAMTVRTD